MLLKQAQTELNCILKLMQKITPINKQQAIQSYYDTAVVANEFGLGINAGHDLSLENLKYFADHIPNLLEVSIGHAFLVSGSAVHGNGKHNPGLFE